MLDHTLEVPKFEGDVSDHQGVGMVGDGVRVMSPLAVMNPQTALIHAAHIVALADRSENFQEFREILKAVLAKRRVVMP